ncbi:MAG: PAS domain S-box protein [Alkalispirochaetaceae bacterium]
MASILLVDDDTSTLEAYRQLLTEAGHEVFPATDGVHALALLDTRRMEVIVTDMVMPYIDGYRLLRIVSHRYNPRPFAIALSAAAMERKDEPRDRCVDAYVAKGAVKPTAEILLQVIEGRKEKGTLLAPPEIRPRRMTVELLQRERELNYILERMGQGVIRTNREGKVVYANRSALEFLETSESDLVGRELAELLRSYGGGNLLNGELPKRGVITVQGGHLLLRAELEELEVEDTPGRLLFLTNATSEHAFSASVRRSEQGYRAIVESTADLLWTIDLEGNLTYVNPSARHFTGYSMGEYYDHGLPLLFGMENSELREFLEEARIRCNVEGSMSLERQLPTKEGGELWSQIRITPLKDESGETIGLRCLATNIDRRHRAEQKLKNAVAERETLIRELHHRVKNSVQLIISMLRLRLSFIDSAEVQAASQVMESRIRVIAQVYAQLYEHRRIDRLDGKALIESIVQNVRTEGRPFNLEVAGEPFVLSLDQAIPVGLIVRELAMNVVDHVATVRQGAQLTVSWRIEAGRVILVFRDNGPGIPLQVISAPVTLGYLIATSLAEQLRGSVSLDKRRQAVTVTFPYAPPGTIEKVDPINGSLTDPRG